MEGDGRRVDEVSVHLVTTMRDDFLNLNARFLKVGASEVASPRSASGSKPAVRIWSV